MAINATNEGTTRELIPEGVYMARCYSMIEIGTVEEEFQGTKKNVPKARISWELPTELKVYKEERGEEPLIIGKEYSLYMNEKANLRKTLTSWRGKAFTEEEAKKFDIKKLLGVPCMLNIIHKPNKDGSRVYEEISSITPLMKGVQCPAQIRATEVFEYDNPDAELFNSLPDFIKSKIKTTPEYKKWQGIEDEAQIPQGKNEFRPSSDAGDDLPF